MHIMQELPTIKTNFLFENSQDFNQTIHGRPQDPIVFIHNIRSQKVRISFHQNQKRKHEPAGFPRDCDKMLR